MLGFRYLKTTPTTYVLHYRSGKIVQEGVGLSFFYFAPPAVIVLVPISSRDVPFVFNEVTSDFQDVTIQGELTYRIRDSKKIAELLDHSVDAVGRYKSDDPGKLNDRLIHAAQILARSYTQKRTLNQVLVSSDALVGEVLTGLKQAAAVAALGVEVLDLSLIGLKATPEMAKALQTDAREQLLKRADEAIYARRNAAVELERTIKENELNTEIAIEQKKQQMRESQMTAEIAVEQQRANLVDAKVDNDRKETQSRAAALTAMLEPVKTVDWRTLMVVSTGLDSKQMIGLAFQQLAENAAKIGELNISPDLLNTLLHTPASGGRKPPVS
ncbi:MAG: SPFH domain-containing protein [Planctomycetaceae bacterium]|nr:SPFH domain-containing protein [Planctomycetaceae bacterium]